MRLLGVALLGVAIRTFAIWMLGPSRLVQRTQMRLLWVPLHGSAASAAVAAAAAVATATAVAAAAAVAAASRSTSGRVL